MFAKKTKAKPVESKQPAIKSVDPLQLKAIISVGSAIKKWTKQMKNTKQRVNILKEWIST